MTRMTTEQLISVQGGGYFDGFLCGAGVVALLLVATGTGGVTMPAISFFLLRLGVLGFCVSAFS